MKLNPIDIAISKMVHDAEKIIKERRRKKKKNTFSLIVFRLNNIFFNIFLMAIKFFYKKVPLKIKNIFIK